MGDHTENPREVEGIQYVHITLGFPIRYGLQHLICLDESILQYKKLCALQNPTKHDLKTLRLWLEHSEYGDNFLRGVERDIFHIDDPNDPNCDDKSSDLVTVSHEAVEKDYFSRWVSDELVERFHNLIGHRWKVPIQASIY
jgi:hypothetical protein